MRKTYVLFVLIYMLLSALPLMAEEMLKAELDCRYFGTLYIIYDENIIDVNRYMLKQGGCVPYQPKPKGCACW